VVKIGGDTTLPASLRALVAGPVGEGGGALGAVPLKPTSTNRVVRGRVGGVIGVVVSKNIGAAWW
jgi:hypothetical protein